MTQDPRPFTTSDMWLAASVVAATNANEVHVERPANGDRRARFVVACPAGADCDLIAAEFRSERLQVNAAAFMRAIRRLKRALYDGE
ncbi:MAG: hypothetical protein COY42_18500 [Armatimonadetes bacterium CG_4_10_14_0_8_um_filter_66_14]|nr:hypothetical protein [Armatimonadota bacterium]PIU94451.1 MAG: hypothetical protein COS65_07500 [Armatimonadetes bacterium CG06_land_8_20_14_3_00_66_21]PIX46992.1 MAG: hypothetical protein COZ57_09655 [Armatimonadetes bacterium CG_4_8_14_3_um_filter_66_20]PIY49059.1 MAG: hypothetical protein COZ05_01445 [Armatimonadetes bacterium CG_4_10_14_3_um_filter_59_10]PIZ41817.1 MAG: hypothetical protein COY42_18500 [Armatimonadetes bacterium CG_4_10_14_0_8_um_filter_66_14]PJB72398.1 MAG: hypothetica